MVGRKTTAWKKNRKLGDVYGGRKWPKLADKIFARCHGLQRPSSADTLPILIQDNPSRDFFFPVDGVESLSALAALPAADTDGITHVWLRRLKRSDYETGTMPLAEFICGSGVRLVVLYPWPRDMLLRFGQGRPRSQVLNRYAPWCTDLVQHEGEWALRWERAALRRFYVMHLLFHEVGHHVDHYQRRWSKANRAQVEEYANQYAMQWSVSEVSVFDARGDTSPGRR